MSPSIHPLHLDPKKNEPYLRLPEPYSHIIVTPPRPDSDPEAIISILNDPQVHLMLVGAPFPHTLEHASRFLNQCKDKSNEVWDELRDENRDGPRGPTGLNLVDGCPVRILREVLEDSSDVYLGDIGCSRSNFFHIVDPEQAKILEAENSGKELGNPEIVWSIGDYLDSKYHGRGIMSSAVHTLIHEWMVPRMGVRKIIVNTNEGNIGSVKVFEKNGFVMRETLTACKERPESKGGGKFGLHVLEWAVENLPAMTTAVPV